VFLEGVLEHGEALIVIPVLSRLDHLVEVRMRSQNALREGNQSAGEDIRPFDCHPDWRHLIRGLQIVRRTVADRLAAVNVHGVGHGLAHPLG